MKKFMSLMLMLFIFLFSITRVNAEAILETEETAVGSIKLKLAFEQGYVGAVDTYIKLDGQVRPDNLIWDSSLSGYVKRYSYNENTGVIRIIILAGESKNNLLDKYGNLNIGELKLSNNTLSNQSYSFSLNSVDLVDATYKTNVNIEVDSGVTSEYILRVDNTPVSPINPIIPDNNNNQDVSTNVPSYDDITYDEGSPSDQVIDDEIDNEDSDEESKEVPVINNDKKSDNNKIEEKTENLDVETHNQRIVKYLWIVLGSLIVIAIILATIYARKTNRIEKVQ